MYYSTLISFYPSFLKISLKLLVFFWYNQFNYILNTLRMVTLLKKFLILLFLLSLLLTTYSFSFANELELFGEGAVLLDYDSLDVLYEKNSHEKLYPASTTKIMTGILAIENGNLNDIISIDKEVVDLTAGTHIALELDEELTLEQLLHALLIESANDAAIAIAIYVSGDVDSFVKLMNEKAHSLGAVDTNFKNPNGLPDEDHFTTAYDLAIITKYAMGNEYFRDIVKNYRSTIPPTNKKTEPRYLNSSNRMLYSNEKILVGEEYVPIRYEGINGVKSGYTQSAKYCLVTSMERDDQKFIAVSLKADRNDIYSDIHKLFDYGLKNFKKTRIGFSGKFIDNFNIKNGTVPSIPGITKSDSFYILNSSDVEKIKEKIVLKEELKAPIARDEVIGIVEYMLDDKVLAQSDIVSAMDIRDVKEPSLLSKVLCKWYWFIIFGFILIRSISLYKIRKRRKQRRIKTLYKF